MTIKYIEQYWCDRCGGQYEQTALVPVTTMAIGWFKYVNGSGSCPRGETASGTTLDKDMCPDCTYEFRGWWEKGKNNG